MIIEFEKVEEGFYKATNIVNEFNAYIDQDLLGGYTATYENDDLTIADEKSFDTQYEAASWLDRNDHFIMSTTFGA
jgi:hypothetical protein